MQERGEASRDRSRLVGTVALGAGVAFIAGEVLHLFKPHIDSVACVTGDAYLVNLIDLLKYGLMGIALLLFVGMLGDRLSRVGRIVGRAAGVGPVVGGVVNGIEHCAQMDWLGVLYAAGLFIGFLSSAAFGVFLARSRSFPSWAGWAISVGALVFFAAAQEGGAVVIGLVWISVGVRLITALSTTYPTD